MTNPLEYHPTIYRGMHFGSRLEARWACFFDKVGWTWEYEPIEVNGWKPTFLVEFPCRHSECGGSHSLLVEVQPFDAIEDFDGHPGLEYPFGSRRNGDCSEQAIPAEASAAFGINPEVTYWEMGHGAGGGSETLSNWISEDMNTIWQWVRGTVR